MAPNDTVTFNSKKEIKKYSRIYPDTEGDEIVISGISGKFPNSRNVTEYEYNLYNKIDMVDEDERRWKHFNTEIPKRCGKIHEIEKFDATFFGVHFKQAHTMDPQCRMLIESAYEAVLDAGIHPKSLRGTRTGVYVGACLSESEKTWFYEKISSGGFGITGCSRAMMANRISYTLGLNGPSYLVDTACSSSMYALDNAFSGFRNGEIDAAIIGGANLILHPYVTLQFARLGVLAPNGYCRPFDQNATGYTRSEAINCLFLQRRRDAKRIYATVVYSKTNCDGHKPEGITYPSGLMQEKLLREFYSDIDVRPRDIGFLEAHSTGTVVGDPEECRAIDSVLCKERDEPLLIGSVKSNIGHSEAASGICSLVKACLAFQKGKIAPNINFESVKKEIPALAEGRLKVVSDVEVLPKNYIGINSFGFGGANAHCLLRGNEKERIGVPKDDLPRLVNWSGRTEEGINTIFDFIESNPLDDEFIGLLRNIQRESIPGFVFRGYGLFEKSTENEKSVCTVREVQHYTGINRPLVWVFSGMGSQWTEMGTSLMTIPIFRESIMKCHKALKPKGLDLIEILTSTDEKTYDNILHSFVGIAAIQIGLVDILRTLELEPDYIIGHSVGELGCAYADGGFTPEQMILAAYSRGKVSLEMDKIKGSMAAVGLGYKKIVTMLPRGIEVACHNGPDSSTISGPAEEVTKFVETLKTSGIFAKEVPCSNIAYHSRYIAHFGPMLLKYLREIIPNPKPRSSKWLSTSVPKSQWETIESQLCSAEYHTNNLLSSVLFEETSALLPPNALTVEIAPHALLQAILRKSMPNAVHIGLTQRGSKKNVQFFLGALGKLYFSGVELPIDKLYPKIEFPVSKGTPSIAPLIKWDHSDDWFVTKFENIKSDQRGERAFKIDLQSDDEEYLTGHVIDGKVLVPATCYLQFVWETLSLMRHGPVFMDMAVEFEDVRFLRATQLTPGSSVTLTVMIHYATGKFEISDAGAIVVTGTIKEVLNPPLPTEVPPPPKSDWPVLQTKDFYKELRLRGYHYNGAFKGVQEASGDGMWGRVKWNYNWVSFMDCLLQIQIVGTDSRTLLLPTRIQKLYINGKHHLDLLHGIPQEEQQFEVRISKLYNKLVAGGVEITGLHASPVARRKAPGIPVLEKYQFLSNIPTPKLSQSDAVRVCVQIALENVPTMKMKIIEVDESNEPNEPIISNFLDALEDLPLITGDYMYFTKQEDISIPGVHIEDGKLSTQANCTFVVAKNILTNEDFVDIADNSLSDLGFLLSRESSEKDFSELKAPSGFHLIAIIPSDNETIVLSQKLRKKYLGYPTVVSVSERDTEFSWIKAVQTGITKGPVIVVAQNEKLNGIIGLVNCLRKEPDCSMVTCVFIDDPSAPPFDMELPFYKSHLKLGLAVNVYRNGKWGTYRHLQLMLDEIEKPRNIHVYGNVLHRGDLSSLRWFEGPLQAEKCNHKIIYASLNFRDVMLATGRLSVELYGSSRLQQDCVLGFEYSAITKTGKRVMGIIEKASVASCFHDQPSIQWEIPSWMTFEEAATIPVVYITVYYAFFHFVDIRQGKSILIHAGTGGIGLSAIRVALAYGLEVFTTCSTPQKKQFLLETFPELKESHIGNSRDTSFEIMILNETNGKGVDFVLNSLSEDKLLASIRCLGRGGHFLEIGKFDMANDNKIGLGPFLNELSFHAVLADYLLTNPVLQKKMTELVYKDLMNGIIKPLPSTVFKANELEKAFRYLATGKHMGKVLVEVFPNPESPVTHPIKVIPQLYFDKNLVFVIPGGLGGFGLELADWLAIRGAKKLVLSSSRGISKKYQSYRIRLWESYGVTVQINTDDITTREGCEKLLKCAAKLGPIGGIMNLAVILRDAIFVNQTPEKFVESFSPKATATKYLDELSRKMCPHLKYFIVFSSVSCGRGNAGQTNYGMANSIMERIIEQRAADGLPAKAIQWGAVGEVGLVADMAEDKIDMEIGGTLQQRISSCLQELDNLLSNPDPIVASMVVAEKRVRGGKENIIETVMNIMSIRDLKSVSMGTTLAEMGMDSLMAMEIKQTLERDFELFLTPQDLRSLTFQKLQEISESREKEGNDQVKIKLASEDKPKGLEILVKNLGDELNSNKTLLPVVTKNSNVQGLNTIILIPGMEGVAGQTWYDIALNLNAHAAVLQLTNTGHLRTVEEITDAVFEDVSQAVLKTEPFYIVAHSFGALVALEIARRFEKEGYDGQVLLIDGAPLFLNKLCCGHLGETFSDEDVQNSLFAVVLHTIFPSETPDSIIQEFYKIEGWDAKLKKFLEYSDKQNVYTKEYGEKVITAMYNRIKLTSQLDLDNMEPINSPITLVRPSEVSVVDIEEDYGLSKLTKDRVTLKFVEGNHTTMLDNPRLIQVINDSDPFVLSDRTFEDYLHR